MRPATVLKYPVRLVNDYPLGNHVLLSKTTGRGSAKINQKQIGCPFERDEIMTQVSVQEAQGRLPELLTAAALGEWIEIQDEHGRTFRLTAVRSRPTPTGIPRAGSCRGLIEVPDDFDAPLDELREYMG
jgi:antitoxin (DNA-binding transcriptional repressor) of toxin-antitoxin stability system